eukprot:CAMPEP_0198199638 /NCGR_PEP_ID=MMETSP1445-20131203/2871_1 /TAXON_ID=36898 /ORGANISM="Pyramimonas sp., Strain CCMP2087" /LENGTH=266 /DNA_ID=CAMNT_0043869523 /DNA_START=159 /DNA_END=959 /DNA_ORIENTATION=+
MAAWSAGFLALLFVTQTLAGPLDETASRFISEVYEGSYKDPNHPDGWRVIMASVKKDTVLVAGVDQKDGEVWWTEGAVVGNVLQIDFSKKSKGKVGKLAAKSINGGKGLLFADGNTWKRYASKDSSAVDFTGRYSDPNHPEGWRIIAPTGLNDTIVVGVDDSAGAGWWTKGTVALETLEDEDSKALSHRLKFGLKKKTKATLLIDFSKKSGGKVGVLTAELVEKGIEFADGNVWSRTSWSRPWVLKPPGAALSSDKKSSEPSRELL